MKSEQLHQHLTNPCTNGRTLEEACVEVERELGVRERVYDKWVEAGKLRPFEAKERGERMQAALTFLSACLQFAQSFKKAPAADASEHP